MNNMQRCCLTVYFSCFAASLFLHSAKTRGNYYQNKNIKFSENVERLFYKNFILTVVCLQGKVKIKEQKRTNYNTNKHEKERVK